MVKTRKCSRKVPTSRRTSKSLSKMRSQTARKQRRHADGTFAKGFKKTTTPRKTTTTKTKTRSKVPNTKRVVKKASTRASPTRKTRSSSVKRGTSAKMGAVERSFDFRCDSDTKQKVIRTVSENFSSDEIKKIDSQGKPIVTNKIPAGKEGAYDRVTTDRKVDSPSIHLTKKPDETAITHEVLHHLRTVDTERTGYAKTAYPVDNKGVSKSYRYEGKKIHEKVKNAEETATTAETEIRTKNPGHVSIYWKANDNDTSAKSTRDRDRKVLRSNGAMEEGTNATGKDAIRMMNKNYPNTEIKSKRVGGESALDTFKKIFLLRGKRKW